MVLKIETFKLVKLWFYVNNIIGCLHCWESECALRFEAAKIMTRKLSTWDEKFLEFPSRGAFHPQQLQLVFIFLMKHSVAQQFHLLPEKRKKVTENSLPNSLYSISKGNRNYNLKWKKTFFKFRRAWFQIA